MDTERDRVEQLLVEACPSFSGSDELHEWREDWAGEAEAPLYLLASAFVRHLTRLNAVGRRDEFPAVFTLLERLLIHGDGFVTELATIGFFEGLQNTNLHPADSAPSDFVAYLGPVSRWWWKEVELFWSGQIQGPIGSSGRPHPPGMGNSARGITTRS